jgi:hypothetical protein
VELRNWVKSTKKADGMVNARSAIATVRTTVDQKVTPPKSLCTSCTKSKLSKNEYITIHRSITKEEPGIMTQVMRVQLLDIVSLD